MQQMPYTYSELHQNLEYYDKDFVLIPNLYSRIISNKNAVYMDL